MCDLFGTPLTLGVVEADELPRVSLRGATPEPVTNAPAVSMKVFQEFAKDAIDLLRKLMEMIERGQRKQWRPFPLL